jgi:aryl sulfotransferase
VKNLIWLASYPKSGNTWLRAFLSNLSFTTDKPVSISQMTPKYWANDKRLIEKYADFEPSELTDKEIFKLRPEIYKQHSIASPNFPYLKIHDALHNNENNIPIIPLECTYKVVYLVRNPLDIAVSLAHHQQQSFDKTIEFMSDLKAVLGKDSYQYNPNSLEVLLSWTEHVKSWLNSDTDLLLVKYEEMQQDPLKTFSKLAKFLELDYTVDAIKKAIAFSDFMILKEEESKVGFGNKNLKSNSSFFRAGKLGSGREELTLEQIEQVRLDHEEIMKCLNYY